MTWIRDRMRQEDEERRRLRSSLFLAISALTVLVVLGTTGMRYMEEWSWISAFYFSVTTLATVGYGDLHPTHEMSRLFVALYVMAGVAIALTAMTVVGRNYLEFIERRSMRERWRLRHPNAPGPVNPRRGSARSHN